MYDYELSFAGYAKLYNQTLVLFKKAKKEFNKIKDGSFDEKTFEEIEEELRNSICDLSSCHYELSSQYKQFSEEEQILFAKYEILNQSVNRILMNYQNYKKIMNDANCVFVVEKEEEISIN